MVLLPVRRSYEFLYQRPDIRFKYMPIYSYYYYDLIIIWLIGFVSSS